MKAVLLCIALVAFSIPLDAQTKPAPVLRLSHALNPHPAVGATPMAYRDTVRVLALMVDFQPSTNTKITGTGKFALTSFPGTIDPPPHDISYFTYKLQFIQNYFRKVSNGKLAVVGTILNRVVTVSKQPQDYAPVAGDNNRSLANLVAESWMIADTAYPNFPFNQYDAFVIFHAGVGHDLNLTNLLGYDPTPYDLPSLYLGPQALKDAFNDQTYSGIPVSGGAYRIDNTILLPETESHYFTNSQGFSDTIQVSINGLFAASIGSYLGLPDLWNTKTGQEGIGQYGLEDGASFFAFYGVFPPEPCAWEKIWLGWVTPITISASTQNVVAPAVSLYHTGTSFFGQDTVYKIPITDKEYFLVENRSRDPYGNGQTLKIVQNGSVVSKTFMMDTAGFNNDDISSIKGSVIDVQDFDWALLGQIDSTHQFDGGGIHIWHIDEIIIDAGLATNTINADPNARGIYLEEAKGPQDIGQSYPYLEGGYGNTTGNPFNAWYLGNPSSLYSNVFGRSTFPNSNSNAGAYSLVTIKDFSHRLPRMTFTVQFGDDYLKPVAGFPKYLGVSNTNKSVQTWTNGIYVSKGDSVFVFRWDGSSATPDPTGLLTASGGAFPLAFDTVSTNSFFVGAKDSTFIIVRCVDVNADGVFDTVQTSSVKIQHRITTAPLADGQTIVAGHADDGIVQLDPNSRIAVASPNLPTPNTVLGIALPDYWVVANAVRKLNGPVYSFSSSFAGFVTGGQGGPLFLVDTLQRMITILKSDLSLLGQASLSGWSGAISKPVSGDVYHSGDQDVVLTAGNTLLAFNPKGYLLDGFPVQIAGGSGAASPPMLRKLTSAGTMDILVVNATGLLTAYSAQGKLLAGFPISIGTTASGRPASFAYTIAPGTTQTGISVMGDDGKLYAYQVSVSFVPVDTTPTSPISQDFLPASRVYNWPNPVYGNSTHIRFYSVQDANVTVRVFDIAGTKVAELTGRANAGVDSEILWDVSHIQSGVYLARVEASNQTQSSARIIKIAIVK